MKPIFRTLLLIQILMSAYSNGYAQSPLFNSDSSAAATIFLDFDGHYVAGTSWNWNGPISAAPAGLDAAGIKEVFNRVAEDYRPFLINVTTDSTRYLKAPLNQRVRVIVTSSSEWYGRAGGVAFIGSFTWGDETPCWIFSTLLQNKPKYVAEACSHEAGHTLGLQHQSVYDQNGIKTAEYNAGGGEGEIGWAPIMGVGYYQNLTTWHVGPSSAGCGVIQNDLNVITSQSNGIQLRDDDHGNSPLVATPIKMQGVSFQVNGQISKALDVDAFKLVLDRPNAVRLSAVPNNVGIGNLGADIDLKIFILNNRFDTIGTYNPSNLLDAVIDTTLKQGTYYLAITATGNAYHSDYGSLGDYALTGSVQSLLPIHEFVLKAADDKGVRTLTWNYTSDEKVRSLNIENSTDGKSFQSVSLVASDMKNLTLRSTDSRAYYRIKAVTSLTDQTYYSNIVHIDGKSTSLKAKALNTLVKGSLRVTSSGSYAYQLLDAKGASISAGTLTAGINTIDASRSSRGLLLLRITDGAESWTEKLIKE
ncbi:MAG: hypothetical protein ABI151_05290 [Chitinophagaceae bacterium]